MEEIKADDDSNTKNNGENNNKMFKESKEGESLVMPDVVDYADDDVI